MKAKKIHIFILIVILLLTLFIRANNFKNYWSFWADDGGGHAIYAKILIEEHRLPKTEDTYLAWHEPVYYIALMGWDKINNIFSFDQLKWWEVSNILIYFIFLWLVYLFTYLYSQKNQWLALLNVFIFSVFFIGVKLSAYINNELLFHTLVLWLLILFKKQKLTEINREKKVIIWSVILALTILTKITGWVILIGTVIFWLIKTLTSRQISYLKYILLAIAIVGAINLPWIIYKQKNFGTYFSINIYN